MITHLSVKGFKTLKDFSVPLTRVSVLVGPNNCGKSNVIRALSFLGSVVHEGIGAAIDRAGGASEVFSRGEDQPIQISVQARFGKTTLSYSVGSRTTTSPFGVEEISADGEFEIRAALDSQGMMPVTLSLSETRREGQVAAGDMLRRFVQRQGIPEPLGQLCNLLFAISVADFSIDRLRARSLPSPGVSLEPNGANLAAVLDRLHGDRLAIHKKIEKEIAAVAPSITGIVTPTVDTQGNKVVAIVEGDQVFKAEAMSDGILLFIALSTISHASGNWAFICLEEPDKGIHPRRIKEILEQINRVASTGSQFLLTTHSPVLLNEFRDFPESVLILDRTDENGTRARQLSSLPDVQEQLRDVSLGDLWYSGVLGGVPPK